MTSHPSLETIAADNNGNQQIPCNMKLNCTLTRSKRFRPTEVKGDDRESPSACSHSQGSISLLFTLHRAPFLVHSRHGTPLRAQRPEAPVLPPPQYPATARLPAPAPGVQSPLESPQWARGKFPPAPAAAEAATAPRQARTLPKRNKVTPMLLGQSIEGREDRNWDKLTTSSTVIAYDGR